jgi:hypothetical protein
VLHPYVALAIAIACVVALETWRRRLRYRAPRWVHATAIVLLVTIVLSIGYAEHRLRAVFATLDEANPAEKATVLARGISDAMNANAAAVLATLLAVVVLAIGSWLARRNPAGGPVARLR